jgi:ferrochelatase
MPANPNSTAVLLLAHGSPERAEEMPEYLKCVTGGRPLPQHVIDEITHRYALVGFSPLTCWTLQQSYDLAKLLGMPVYVGMRNWKPFIAEAVAKMSADGVKHAVVICLAPQNSRTSVGLYRRALEGEGGLPFTVDFVESWHDHPMLIQAFAEKLTASHPSAPNAEGWATHTAQSGATNSVPHPSAPNAEGWATQTAEGGAPTAVPVIFTAHSVPERTISEGDPYQAQAHETAELVAKAAGLAPGDWTFAFQSQGMSRGAWIGPTVEDTILSLKAKGATGVFIQPIGFLCDHVEVLYDIDIAFKQFAEQNGMRLWRAESLNGSATLTAALADIVRQRLATRGLQNA